MFRKPENQRTEIKQEPEPGGVAQESEQCLHKAKVGGASPPAATGLEFLKIGANMTETKKKSVPPEWLTPLKAKSGEIRVFFNPDSASQGAGEAYDEYRHCKNNPVSDRASRMKAAREQFIELTGIDPDELTKARRKLKERLIQKPA